MRMLLASMCSASVAAVLASPATAGDPPPGAPAPGAPSDAAIAQYIEVVPTATGVVPVGEPGDATALPSGVRARVERTAGTDAPLLIDITADSRFGARPVARADTAKPTKKPVKEAPADTEDVSARPAALQAASVPGPLAAAASTADSGGVLVVGLLLAAITATGIAGTVLRR